MKNIHILPTDKPSRLFKDDFDKYFISINIDQEQSHFTPQHIYITSDEKIKAGDWYLINGQGYAKYDGHFSLGVDCKKIILTTDQDLIKDGVQAIDDDFLKWFVKNPSCEFVEIKYIKTPDTVFRECDVPYGYYKIIIPQEEPKQIKCYCGHTTYCDCEPLKEPTQTFEEHLTKFMSEEANKAFNLTNKEPDFSESLEQTINTISIASSMFTSDAPKQETLEEAAEKEFPLVDTKWCRTGAAEEENFQLLGHRRSFVKGAKWQAEKMYSEEEVRALLIRFQDQFPDRQDFQKWFEQNKKR